MRRHGFTLLETLVALAITALVLSALGTAVRRAADARTRATAAADRAALARTVLLRLANELEAVSPGAGSGGVASVAPDPARPWSALRFETAPLGAAFGSEPAGDVRAVGYRVEPDGARADTGALVRRERARPAPPGAPEPPGLVLMTGVRTFRVRCLAGGAWQPACGPDLLPRAVEVVLAVDDGHGGIDERAITVTLPAAG